jgi:UrcA family protein
MKTPILARGLAALALAAAVPAAAQAAPAYVIGQVRVDYGDLDLAAPAGAAAMLARLDAAAARACGRLPQPGDPLYGARQRAHRLCKVSAIDAATLALEAPLVRIAWLETGEATRWRDAAQRSASALLELAGADAPAALARN